MQKAIWLVIVGGLLYWLAPILTPFVVGALLAYLVDPLVNQLMRLRLPRLLSVTIVFLTLFILIVLLILLLIPLIEKQIAVLVVTLPKMVAWVQNIIIPWFVTHFGLDSDLVNIDALKSTLVENWTKVGGVAEWVWKTTLHSGFSLLEWLMRLLLIPVVTFYLLCDWDKVIQGCRDHLPRPIEPTVVRLVTECDIVLSAFFRGQLLVMLALGMIYSIGLTLIGLQLGLIIGLISGLMSIVPYLGFIVGIVAASIAAFVQFGTLTSVMLVCGIFLAGHLLDHMVLTPYLVGNRIGLHPVAVIFAILVGGSLCGFFGVLLALPVAAVVMVLIRYLNERYLNSQLYQKL